MSNEALRRFAAGNGVKLWQVAEALGIADTSLSRKMRKEATARRKRKNRQNHSRAFAGGGLMATLEPIAVTEKQKIFEIIREISAEM